MKFFQRATKPAKISNQYQDAWKAKEKAFYGALAQRASVKSHSYGSSDALIETWEQMLSDMIDRELSPDRKSPVRLPVGLIKAELSAGADPNELSVEAIHYLIEKFPVIRLLTIANENGAADLLDILIALVGAGWKIDARAIDLIQLGTGFSFYRRIKGCELLADRCLLGQLVTGIDEHFSPIGPSPLGSTFIVGPEGCSSAQRGDGSQGITTICKHA